MKAGRESWAWLRWQLQQVRRPQPVTLFVENKGVHVAWKGRTGERSPSTQDPAGHGEVDSVEE